MHDYDYTPKPTIIHHKHTVLNMAVEQESISKILSILSHPLRREILLNLSEKGESSFTELLNLLKVDTGKLSFHLRSLEAFIEQTPSGKYKLSRAGENAVRIVHDIEGWAEVADIQRKESQLPLASLKKRTGGFLIDFAIILAITTAIIFLPSALSMNLKSLLSGGLSTVIFITVGCFGSTPHCWKASTDKASANASQG